MPNPAAAPTDGFAHASTLDQAELARSSSTCLTPRGAEAHGR